MDVYNWKTIKLIIENNLFLAFVGTSCIGTKPTQLNTEWHSIEQEGLGTTLNWREAVKADDNYCWILTEDTTDVVTKWFALHKNKSLNLQQSHF